MKKALDQTVRNVKREVHKKVLKVPEIERKVLEATCNEPWGPHGTLMSDIAHSTRNINDYQMIMTILWRRLNDSGRNWRHVYKSLTVMEFLVGHGAERVIEDLREHTYQIQTLVDFQHIDSSGRDQGINVRRKAQSLVALINDKEKIREVRQKAAANRDKYRGVSSVGGIYRSSSYTSTAGTYEEDDRYGRRDDRSYDERYKDGGYGDRSRDEGDRYGGDRYGDRRERDRYGDRYDGPDRDRSGYDDARNNGTKDDDEWRRKSRTSPPSYEEVSNAGEATSVEKRDVEPAVEKQPVENGSPPAPTQNNAVVVDTKSGEELFDDFDPRANASTAFGTEKLSTSVTAPSSFMSSVEELFADSGSAPSDPNLQNLAASNPFGSSAFRAESDTFSGPPTAGGDAFSGQQAPSHDDALALALAPQYSSESPESSEPVSEQNIAAPEQHPQSQQQPGPTSQPFSQQAPPFVAQHQFPVQQGHSFQQQAFPPQQPAFAPSQPYQQSFPPQFNTFNHPARQQSLGQQAQPFNQQALPFAQPSQQAQLYGQQPQQGQAFPQHGQPSGQQPQQSQPFGVQAQQGQPFNQQAQQFGQQPQRSGQQPQVFGQQNPQAQPFGQQSQPFGQQSQSFGQQPQQLGQQAQPFGQQSQQSQQVQQQQTSVVTKAKQQEKFQPKSAVWADTLSSGLVDLNIGPLKNDPLAELGIQIKESKVSVAQQRREEKLPTTMGKAMGSGTGIGLAGASILGPALPPPPPIMGPQPGMGVGTMGMGMRPPPPMGMMGPMMPMPGMMPGGMPMMDPRFSGPPPPQQYYR